LTVLPANLPGLSQRATCLEIKRVGSNRPIYLIDLDRCQRALGLPTTQTRELTRKLATICSEVGFDLVVMIDVQNIALFGPSIQPLRFVEQCTVHTELDNHISDSQLRAFATALSEALQAQNLLAASREALAVLNDR
jgi:hypothetical protein